jgi:hypothetical protein
MIPSRPSGIRHCALPDDKVMEEGVRRSKTGGSRSLVDGKVEGRECPP